MMAKYQGKYRFSFGPWNIHEGEDPFGPAVRKPETFAKKLQVAKDLGFDGVQFHDDDVSPDIDSKSHSEVMKDAKKVRKMLDNAGLKAEFVAPRLWFAKETIDGAYTSNDPKCRKYAVERSKQAVDIMNVLGTSTMVMWLAREGSYVRESKNPRVEVLQIRDAFNALLEYDSKLMILVEPKPNEPVDSAIIPTIGHAVGLGFLTVDPARCGCLVETAHSVLAGLDPADDMAYALAFNKLKSVHLNDQTGLKFDQDKTFGSVDLRRAFNQVRVLEEYAYGRNGEWVGLDVKVLRTQKQKVNTKHLAYSKRNFLALLDKVATLDRNIEAQLVKERDYEELNHYITCHLMGLKY
ncbi:MAG TPA: TIM barrel protein [Candidatus Hydrogenedentes bacterium]|nr:TIM barrel protein [Candidatus Hydrogenedentota bacterium]HPG66389.1 TIM barrel protein [Candidatus Hydrogenedentota bacterium]